MHFLNEIAHKTTEKVFLPLQTLEFKDVGWGWQINDSGNLQRINPDAIFGYHKDKQTSRLNTKNQDGPPVIVNEQGGRQGIVQQYV